jgi:phage terminase small subunit
MSTTLSALPSAPVTLADLSDRQARFVREFVERGGRPGAAADAAVAAGYARAGRAGRPAARVRASELLHNETVLRFLRDELTRKLNAGAALGVQVLIDLAEHARSEQVRLSAARELVDRGHMPIMSRSAVVKTELTIEDYIEALDHRNAAARAQVIDGQIVESTAASHAPDGR